MSISRRYLLGGAAALVAIGREALNDPCWTHRAAEALGLAPAYEAWPVRHGAWLAKREQHMGPVLRERRAASRPASAGPGSTREPPGRCDR